MYSVFIIHCAATWALAGLIWTVQVSLYPMFLKVGVGEFPAYHAAHMRRITFVVAPLIFLEIGTAGWLLLFEGERGLLFVLSLPLLGLNWVSTALVQVPLHKRLERGGWDAGVIARLVRSNWIRTIAWSVRGVFLCGMLAN